ncbi:7403_t:CDS:1, partial [Gigaspora rosea]
SIGQPYRDYNPVVTMTDIFTEQKVPGRIPFDVFGSRAISRSRPGLDCYIKLSIM